MNIKAATLAKEARRRGNAAGARTARRARIALEKMGDRGESSVDVHVYGSPFAVTEYATPDGFTAYSVTDPDGVTTRNLEFEQVVRLIRGAARRQILLKVRAELGIA